MQILKKHKTKGEDGFKKFVQSLETTSPAQLVNITTRALLEDPVYMSWIITNMIDFYHFFNLSVDAVMELDSHLPNLAKLLANSLYDSTLEERALELMTKEIQAKYMNEKEITNNVTPDQKQTARTAIVKAIRDLQSSETIEHFDWKLPTSDVLHGTHLELPKSGSFTLNYEDGTPALEGGTVSKLREGEWKHYYPNGTLMAVGEYSTDEKVGEWIFYYSDGSKKAEGRYEENLKQGEWTHYEEDGTSKVVNYKRGKVDKG